MQFSGFQKELYIYAKKLRKTTILRSERRYFVDFIAFSNSLMHRFFCAIPYIRKTHVNLTLSWL